MVTLSEYKRIYEDTRKRIEAVRVRATKISTKGNFFDPITLKNSCEAYLKQIAAVYSVYTTAASYSGKDFTHYTSKLQSDLRDFEAKADKLESIAEAIKKNGC